MKKIIFTALFFAVGLGLSADDWPQWRGPNRDGISRETGLLQAWPSAGPKRVWLSRDIGIGYSAPVVAKGRLFVLGTKGGKEQLFAKEAKGNAVDIPLNINHRCVDSVDPECVVC